MKNKIIAGLVTLGHPSHKFIDSFVQIVQSGIFARYCKVTSCLLPYARNEVLRLVTKNDPDYTHIFFIDDDMDSFTIEDIQDLINADKPIISGIYLHRSLPYRVVHNFDRVTDEQLLEYIQDRQIVQVNSIATGFTLIKREVFDALCENTPDGPIWFTMDRQERDSFRNEVEEFLYSISVENIKDIKAILYKAISLGQNCMTGSNMIGEDITFCKQAKKFGFDSWVHCGVLVGHLGEFSFNLRELLPQRPELKLIEA